jgi:hypothetical protein
MLKLREGWQIGKMDDCYKGSGEWVWADFYGASWEYAYAKLVNNKVYAYPNGDQEDFEFDSIEEAHAYLLSVGSESPWEVVE